MGGHRHRRVSQCLKRCEISGEFLRAGGDFRQGQMTIRSCATMAGNMFNNANNTRLGQSLQRGGTELDNAIYTVTKGAIPNNVMSARLGDIQHRSTIYGDTNLGKLQTQRLEITTCRLASLIRIFGVGSSEGCCRWPRQPFGRTQAGNTSPFLVDEDRKIISPGGLA